MLCQIRQRNGKVLVTLICDCCRKQIKQADYRDATVDFTPITLKQLASMPADQVPPVRHFHGECAPIRCTGSHWQKADHVLLAMVGGLFDEPGDDIGTAVTKRRLGMRPDVGWPWP
jgi:hypothetical protein